MNQPYQQPAHPTIRKLLLALLLMTVSACNNLGFVTNSDGSSLPVFAGIESINVSPDGRYTLSWNHATSTQEIGSVTYEVYLDRWESIPAGIVPRNSTISSTQNEGRTLSTSFADIPDGQAPISQGVLLSSVQGMRSYTLDEKLQPNVIYAFQVRIVSTKDIRDSNQRVMIYDASSQNISFAGISGLELTPTSKLLLSWEPPTNLASGVVLSDISYEVFIDSTPDAVDTVVQAANAASNRASRTDTTSVGQLIDLPATRLPSRRVAPLTSQKGGLYYEIADELSPSLTYILQVKASGTAGETGESTRVAVYRPRTFTFSGLTQDSARLSEDLATINLSWRPAEGGLGPVTYTIYADADWTKPLATTNEITYEFQDAKPGQTYTFAVRAQDRHGYDDNRSFAVVKVPVLSFVGLQQAGAVLAADNSKIDLSWNVASNAKGKLSYLIFDDSNFSSVIGETTATSFTIDKPTPGKLYTLGVRAKDANGFDSNTSLVTIPVPDQRDKQPPSFTGLSTAEAISHNKILLRWQESRSSDIATYNIYYPHNLTAPIAATADNHYVVTGLTAATSYSFVVRARDTSGNEDDNSVQKSAQTPSFVVPDFAGIDTVENLAGPEGLTKLKLTWLPAAGNVSGYQVYQSTSTGDFDFLAPVLDLASATASAATISNLTSDTRYYFVVRAYDSTSGSARFEHNRVEKSAKTLAANRAPSFAGISAAAPGAGSLGLSTIKASWGSPQTDGVYDSFVIDYEAGSCASGFSATASMATAAGVTTRDYTITGLTPQTTYRLRVRTHYSFNGIKDNNSACQEAYTSPPAPAFAGVGTVSVAAGIAGFSTLNVSWPQASSSFSYYKVEWSTTPNFAVIGGSTQLNTITTLSSNLTNLPVKTTIYVRVSAVFDENGIQLASGASKVLSAKTEPPAPTGEGISSITALAADSLKVSWTEPTNAGALYNSYKLWVECGGSAAKNLIDKLKLSENTDNADHTYPAGQLHVTFTDLAANTECCYQVRAHYADATNTLNSQSMRAHQCQTPMLLAPTFAGVTSVVQSNQATGFSQLTVNWQAVADSQAELFSYYEIAYATTPSGQDWTSGTIKIADQSATSYNVTGLSEKTTYYFRVRAVNSNGSPAANSGNDAVVHATTTPKSPTGDSLIAASSLGATKVQLSYRPPTSNANTGGLFNNVLLFIQAGTTADTAAYRSSVETGGVSANEVSATISAGKVTLASIPAVVRIPASAISADQNNSYQLWGLNPNEQVCIQAVAVYWVDGQTSKYLSSTTPTIRCVTPTASAPSFFGVAELSGFDDMRGFSQMVVNWGEISGECTSVEISATTTPDTPNFTTPIATASCSDRSRTIANLTPHQDYYVQVQAINSVGGVRYAAGQGVELMRTTKPSAPTGDGMVSAVATAVPKAPDTIALTYHEATTGLWNKTYIWRGTGNTQAAAQDAVRTAATPNADNTGPTSAPWTVKTIDNTTATDSNVSTGIYTCYLARAVYDDGSYYNASINETIRCDRPAYTTPTFTGVASASVVGTWPDGTAKIELTFNTVPAGSIEEYWVYYSPMGSLSSFGNLSADPWQKIDYADSTYDANPNDTKILVGGADRPVTGLGHFIVRSKFYYGPDADINTAIAGPVSISNTHSNWVYVPPAVSGLAYPYYIMQYEASLASGAFVVGDSVASSEADLATCNYEFHVNKTALHSSCGTRTSSALVRSVANTAPATATFHQAWMACRASGSSVLPMRLATAEEWQRAARWTGNSYETMWNTYSNNAAANCAVSAASAANTGSAANCKSGLQIYDVAGNLKEWVDSRMLRYDITTNSESRFSYGPVIGRTLANGIDNISRRYHLIDPGVSGLALTMGADYTTPTLSDRKQFGAEVQTWLDPEISTATGFRCVALIGANMPAMADLALPTEPVFTAADIPAETPANWKIPENLYVKDTRWEAVTISVNGNTSDSIAEGQVSISWQPWSKTSCTPTTCNSSDAALSYEIYRFIEPVRFSARLATPWALTGGAPTPNPYSSDKPMDPLAVDASGNRLYTNSSSEGQLIATISDCSSSSPSNCSFVDSTAAGTDFSPRRFYNYILVARDSAGNAVPAMVQRWRSPYFAGDPAVAGAASFRLEPRWRRSAVFLVDEAYQQAQTRPQIMVHVPMHQSGLDHDFFIHKYEASIASTVPAGTFSGDSNGSWAWPIQASSGVWRSNASKCYDTLWRTAAFAYDCGNGSNTLNSTTATLQSKHATAPQSSTNQGDFWQACANTGFSDLDGNTYYLSLPSDAEWLKAADWGDLDLDGSIDVNPVASNIGASVAALEHGMADAATIRCHTDGNPSSDYASNSTETANCRSRYNAADMVGNMREWTSGQIYNAVGYDNGTDGLWLGQSFPSTSVTLASIGARYDLLRALPRSHTAWSVADNGDKYSTWFAGGFTGSTRGSGNANHSAIGTGAGRWMLDILPTSWSSFTGGRCGR